MAINIDATGGTTDSTGATTTLTWSHTCASGSILIVPTSIYANGAGQTLTAKYNGAPMTEATHRVGSNMNIYVFYLLNPTSGTNSIIVTSSAFASGPVNKQFSGTSVSYTGANTVTQPDSSNTNRLDSSTVTNFPVSTTVVNSNCWLVGGATEDAGDIAAGVAGSGTTYRGANQNNLRAADSNGIVSTGNQTLNYGRAGSLGNLVGVTISINAASAGGTTLPYRPLLGVGI